MTRFHVRGRSGQLVHADGAWYYVAPDLPAEQIRTEGGVLDADAVRAHFGPDATFDGFEACAPEKGAAVDERTPTPELEATNPGGLEHGRR